MSTSNETTSKTETTMIDFDHKGFKRATKSAFRSLSLKPTRSFGKTKSLRPRTVLGTKKVQPTKEMQD